MNENDGGEGGIRTHEGLAPLPVFKTGAFNRSATSPALANERYTVSTETYGERQYLTIQISLAKQNSRFPPRNEAQRISLGPAVTSLNHKHEPMLCLLAWMTYRNRHYRIVMMVSQSHVNGN